MWRICMKQKFYTHTKKMYKFVIWFTKRRTCYYQILPRICCAKLDIAGRMLISHGLPKKRQTFGVKVESLFKALVFSTFSTVSKVVSFSDERLYYSFEHTTKTVAKRLRKILKPHLVVHAQLLSILVWRAGSKQETLFIE